MGSKYSNKNKSGKTPREAKRAKYADKQEYCSNCGNSSYTYGHMVFSKCRCGGTFQSFGFKKD